MKKLLRILPLLLATVALFTVTTLSWLMPSNSITFPSTFGGSSKTAYFAGGNGSETDPYLLNSPVHIYNLAWLQYIGYFNLGKDAQDNDINNGRSQTYFKLTDNINMSALSSAIPPIGTEQYPFIGVFDGNGKSIRCVNISTEKGSSYDVVSKYPDNAEFNGGSLLYSTDKSQEISIVGLFGVTGNYKGYADTYADAHTDFSADEMAVKNFYLDKIHIRSSTDSTLMGLAAGYVGSNISNVGVYRGDFSIKPSAVGIPSLTGDEEAVVSSYSLVGAYDKNLVSWTAGAGGSGTNNTQGGTIDIKQICRRLNYIYTKSYSLRPTSGTTYNINSSNFGKVNAYLYFNGNGTYARQFNYQGISEAESYYTDMRYGFNLPLKVDEVSMGLRVKNADGKLVVDDSTNFVEQGSDTVSNGWNLNAHYRDFSTETVASDNTGYITGGAASDSSTSGSGHMRFRISKLGSTTTINKAFGADSGTGLTYDNSKVQILTKNAEGNLKVIGDEKNKLTKESDIYSQLSADGIIKSDTLARYDKIRDDFNDLIGANSYLYGLRFNYNSSQALTGASSQKVTIDGKQYYSRAINFSIENDLVCTMLLGSFVTNSTSTSQPAPYVYKAERDSGGTITGVKKLNYVTKNGDSYTDYYGDDTPPDGSTVVYSSAWFTKLPANCLYYLEIPISANGENDFYVIGGENGNTAYFMYLDIGTNGDGSKPSQKPYAMQSVDFVNSATVPVDSNGNAYYPEYEEVTFTVAGVESGSPYAVYERKTDPETDGSTKVMYNYADILKVTPSKSEYSDYISSLAPSQNDGD